MIIKSRLIDSLTMKGDYLIFLISFVSFVIDAQDKVQRVIDEKNISPEDFVERLNRQQRTVK